MLAGRIDLIHKAISRLNGASPPSDEEFVFLLMNIAELSSKDLSAHVKRFAMLRITPSLVNGPSPFLLRAYNS